MTLCFVTDSYPTLPSFGGIAVYTQRVARALAARGHIVHVIVTLGRQDADIEDEGVHVHLRQLRWLPVIGNWVPGLGESLSVARMLRQMNRQHGLDIVEIPNWEGIGLASTWEAGFKVVIRLHTSLAESIKVSGRKPNLSERFMIWAEKTSTRRALAVVTHSESHRKLMAAAYGREDIAMIPHGINIPEECAPPAGKCVLAIGRMSARKGIETLIEAIPLVLEQAPGASFKIVGTEESHARVRQFRSEHPGLNQVEFLGVTDAQTLDRLYDSCALYVSPSVYESFGFTFAEAMAHGRPVVGCNVSAVPEIVRNGIDGILVPPNNHEALARAIITLLSEETLLRRMGANGRQRAVAEYSIETAVTRIENYFMNLAGKGDSLPKATPPG